MHDSLVPRLHTPTKKCGGGGEGGGGGGLGTRLHAEWGVSRE